MSNENVSRVSTQVYGIDGICHFLKELEKNNIPSRLSPVGMPSDLGTLHFDTGLWMGMGVVGLWSALDAFADRSSFLKGKNNTKGRKNKCGICERTGCLVFRFTSKINLDSGLVRVLEEMEDLRHLFAHHYAGHADAYYFARKRHILNAGGKVNLSCGLLVTGIDVSLDVPHLRYYSERTRDLIQRVP